MPPPTDRGPLQAHLEELAQAIESLLGTGLAAASRSTLEKFEIVFREASRRRLLRLGGTLRHAREEIHRYLEGDDRFSSRRLAFFLNRCWLLTRGLARALQTDDEASWSKLLWNPSPQPAPNFDVVTLGVSKKVSEGVMYGFDFHLRVVAVSASGPDHSAEISEGDALTWSTLFPIKNPKIPPEAFLQLKQKQKFRPSLLINKTVRVSDAAIASGENGGRLVLGPDSKIQETDAFSDWQDLLHWRPVSILQRLRDYEPGPLDLDVELQEEAVLTEWQLEKREDESFGDHVAFPLRADGLELTAVAKNGLEGETLLSALEGLRKRRNRPPLFGLLHFELCRLVFRPLSLLEDTGPKQLMLSKSKIGTRELLRTLDFS